MNILKRLIQKYIKIYIWIKYQIYIRINRLIFKIYDIKFGCNLKVYDSIYLRISKNGSFTVGDNFTLKSGDGINPISRNIKSMIYIAENASIKIGNNTGLSSPCLRAKESITIGNNVKVGGDCIIIDTDSHNLDYRIRNGSKSYNGKYLPESQTAISKPVIIEDDVLIGTRCIILKGVTIGARSIIAAGSVVTKPIPSDCIAGGNPCKVIRSINIH